MGTRNVNGTFNALCGPGLNFFTLSDLEELVLAILGRLSAVEDFNNILKEKVSSLQNTVTTLEDNVAILEEENAALQEKIEVFENQAMAREETLEDSVANLDSDGKYGSWSF